MTMVHAKILSVVAAAGLLVGSAAVAQAQMSGTRGSSQPGMSGSAPGHEMQERGGRPGASGFAPGHERAGDRDRDDRTTGFSNRDRDDRLRGVRDRDDRTFGRGDRDERRRDHER